MNNIEIPFRQQLFIIISGLTLLCIIIELVRRRKILEQYSAIWIAIGVFAISFLWLYPYMEWFTKFIGAGMTTSAVLFLAIFFLLLMNLQFSVKITDFSFKLKDAIQEITLLSNELDQLRTKIKSTNNLNTEKQSDAAKIS